MNFLKSETAKAENYLYIKVWLRPVPKERPRFNRYTGSVYTPAKTMKAENALKTIFHEFKGMFENDAVSVEFNAFYERPRAKRFKDLTWKTSRADVDNIAKLYIDAANKILYKDDAQICCLRVTKSWSDEPDHFVMTFTRLKP